MSKYLTKKDALKEFIACGKNPVYFISTYCTITHPQRQRIPFKLWDFQQQLIKDFNDYPQNIILKSRQLGVSWVSAAYAVWLMMFHREKNIMVVATKFESAANLVKKVKMMIKSLPPWYTEKDKGLAYIINDNETKFTLSNGSEIKAASTSADVGRSEALSLLIIDEAAHIENMDELWSAMGPTLSTGGRCIALSSPNGVSNWFYKQYTLAEKGENKFHPIKLTWEVHPERNKEWEIQTRKTYSVKEFEQEYNASFLASGDTVIDSNNLARIHQTVKNPLLKTGFDRNLWVWEHFSPEKSYALIADVARGDGQDFSGFHIFNVETMNQAVEYKAKLPIDLYSKMLFDIGKEYGNCMIVVENNMLGYEVCMKLIKMGYENVYYQEKGTHNYVAPHDARNAENVVPGFTTSLTNRQLMISKMEEFIRKGFIIINSSRTYEELETFIWNRGKPEAAKGKNDDLIIPMAIGCWIRDIVIKESIRTLQYKKTFLRSIKHNQTTLNVSVPGMSSYRRDNNSVRPDIQQQYRTFSWVIKS